MRLTTLAVAAAAILAAIPAPEASATDAGDAPGARADGQLDLCDLYVFANPQDTARTVFVVTLNPYAGLLGASTFASKATYSLNIDTDQDQVEEDVTTFTFAEPATDGSQAVTVAHRGWGGKWKGKGTIGTAFTLPNGTKVQCGMFDDPAFADLDGLRSGLTFAQATSSNFFKGRNCLALVLDVSNGEFGPHSGLKVWATTARGKKQVDRVGRPLASWLLLLPQRREAFNQGKPKDDRTNFRQDFVNRILTYRGGNTTGVNEYVDTLVPDMLPFAPGVTTGFDAGNGRRLDDDVVDMILPVVTATPGRTDYVGNDSVFLSAFPFLAAPNP